LIYHSWRRSSTAREVVNSANHQRNYRQAERDDAAVFRDKRRRSRAVADREVALAEVSNAAGNQNGRAEFPRRHASRAGEQHEQLQRNGRWQKRRDDHGQKTVPLVKRKPSIHSCAAEALAEKGLAAAACHGVQRKAAEERSEGRHRRVIGHPRGILGAEHDDQEVVDLRKRQEGRIERGKNEQAEPAQTGRPRLNRA